MQDLDVDVTSTGELLELARRLMRQWTRAALALAPADDERVDVHCHVGVDSDGSSIDEHQLLAQLDGAGMRHATAIALHQPGGYAVENERVLAAAAASGGRLHALHRCDPRAKDPAADARAGLDAGAAGLKWHPRAERFGMGDEVARATAAVAHERGAPILIHAGRGMERLGEGVVDLAREHEDATFVLAHAAISDIAWIVEATRDRPNVVFDTSWWRPTDVAVLLATCEPERVLHGSDPPYGTAPLAVQVTTRLARACGWGDEAVAALLGGNARRVLGIGSERLGISSTAIGAHAAHMPVEEGAMRRAAELLAASLHVMFAGGDASEVFDLARAALDVPGSHELAEAAHLMRSAIGTGQALVERDAGDVESEPGRATFMHMPETRRAGVELLIAALAHLATPALPITGIDRVG